MASRSLRSFEWVPLVACVFASSTGCDSEEEGGSRASAGTGGTLGGEAGSGSGGTSGSSAGSAGATGSGGTAGTAGAAGSGGTGGSGGAGQLALLAGEPGGSGYTDGVGEAARFRFPGGVTSDGAGVLFVADPSNQKVRRVDITTRAVTSPYDVFGAKALASDGAGKLYVGNGTALYEFDVATGVRTLIAGDEALNGAQDGVGIAARFSSLSAMAYDGADHLFVAEPDENRIRRITLSTRSVEQFVGMQGQVGSVDGTGTAANFRLPTGLTFVSGKLYVADIQGAVIRSVDVATRVVTTLADADAQWGTVDATGAAARFADPQAIWESGGTLYVGEYSAIRAVNPATGAVTTVAGVPALRGALASIEDGVGALASFGEIVGATTDGGVAYFVDGNGHAVRSFDATGAVTTIAGKLPSLDVTDGPLPTGRLAEPYGIDTDGADRVFIADVGSHRIRLYDRSTGQLSTIAGTTSGHEDGPVTTAKLILPRTAIYDGASALYVFGATSTVRKVNLATQMVSTVAGEYPQSGVVDGIGAAARTSLTMSAAFDGTDTIYFLEGNGAVRRFNINTSEVTTWVTNVAGCPFPEAIAVTADAAYLGERGTVCRVQLSDSSVTTLPPVGGLARALFVGPGSTLYVAGEGSLFQVELTMQTSVRAFGGQPAQVQLGNASSARINYPSAGITLADGTVLLLDREEHVLLSWQ